MKNESKNADIIMIYVALIVICFISIAHSCSSFFRDEEIKELIENVECNCTCKESQIVFM